MLRRLPHSLYLGGMKYYLLPIFLLTLLLGACRPEDRVARLSPSELYALPTINEDGSINAVIEIPAGTNVKLEYQTANERITPDQLDGKDRVIDFLPYVGNYGFIPSTLMDAARGGDGDALDVLVIGSTQPTGTRMKVKPIAIMQLRDSGEIDTKIIAVPTDPAQRVIQAESFKELLIQYDGAKRIIETWFLSYKGLGTVELLGWKDEQAADLEIQKWRVERE